MKLIRKIGVYLFFIFLTENFFAQNYNSIILNKESFFKSSNGNIRAIKIKSAVSDGSDSAYYTFTTFRDTSGGNFSPCPIDPSSASWIGEKVIIKPDGYNIFFNSFHDSIILNTVSNLNDSWILYKFPNSDYIEATCENIDNANILGNIDSVKTFSLQVKDSTGNQITSIFNGKQIILSKNYGLIKLYDFYQFPNDTTPYLIVNEKRYTNGEIYDFEIGDEFHYGFYQFPNYNLPTGLSTKKIISKYFSQNQDTVYYGTEGFQQTFIQTNPQHWEQSEYTDTLAISNLNIALFLTMPEESIIDSLNNLSRYNMFSNFNYNWRTQIEFIHDCISFNPYDSCYQYPFDECSSSSSKYSVGLGEIFWKWESWPYWGYMRELLYYKKGNETWGNPIFPLNIQNPNYYSLQLSISPNPANNFIKTNFLENNSATVKIYNLLGEMVFQSTIQNPQSTINISSLSSGAYILSVTSEGKIYTQKLMIVK